MIYWCKSTPQANWIIKVLERFTGETIHQKANRIIERLIYIIGVTIHHKPNDTGQVRRHHKSRNSKMIKILELEIKQRQMRMQKWHYKNIEIILELQKKKKKKINEIIIDIIKNIWNDKNIKNYN